MEMRDRLIQIYNGQALEGLKRFGFEEGELNPYLAQLTQQLENNLSATVEEL